MKKAKALLLTTLILLSVTKITAAEITLPPSFEKIHFELPENWVQQKQKRRNKLTFTQKNQIATINLTQKVFSEPITANALKVKRGKYHYDSWMNVYERYGTEKENILANVNESYVAVYLSQSLDSKLNLVEKLSGEYYYITNDSYYIITVQSTKSNWKSIQPDVKTILNTFWIGDGTKPIFIPEEGNENEWERNGKNNNNHNYISASPALQKPLEKQWSYTIKESDNLFHSPLLVHDQLFILEKDKLTALNINGKKNWTYNFTDSIKPYLSHKSDTLFLVKDTPKKEIIGLMANDGQILFKVPITGEINNPLIINESILYIEEKTLKSASRLSGKIEWIKEGNFNTEIELVSKKHYVIVTTDSNKLLCYDSRNGKELWKYTKNITLKHDPVIQDNYVYVVESGTTDQLTKIDIKTGKKIWSYKKPLLNLKINTNPTINKDLITLVATINSKTLSNDTINNTVILGIDIKTGKLIWEKEIPSITNRPIITDNFLFFIKENTNKVTVLDTLSGTEIPLKFNKSLPEKGKIKQFNIYKESIFSFISTNNNLMLFSEK